MRLASLLRIHQIELREYGLKRSYNLRDHLQISLLILSEFKRINLVLFPEIIREFQGNRTKIIRLNSLNIRSEVWRGSPNLKPKV